MTNETMTLAAALEHSVKGMVESAVEDAVDRAVESAVEEAVGSAVESAVEESMRNLDTSAIAEEVQDHLGFDPDDMEAAKSKADEAYESAEELKERVEALEKYEPLLAALFGAVEQVVEKRVQDSIDRLAKQQPAPISIADANAEKAHAALGVIVLDPRIRAVLTAMDPKALEQAEMAFGDEKVLAEAKARREEQTEQAKVAAAENKAYSASA